MKSRQLFLKMLLVNNNNHLLSRMISTVQSMSATNSTNKTEKISAKARSLLRFVIKKRNAAQKLANTIVETPNDCIITPFSDFPGPTMSEILALRFSSLTICEPNQDKRRDLENFVNSEKNTSSSRIYIEPDDLEQLTTKTYCNEAQKRCSEIMQRSCDNLNRFPEEKPGRVKYVLPLRTFKYEMSLLNHLYDNTVFKNGLYACDTFPLHYILMTNRRLSFLEAKSDERDLRIYKAISIAFNTLFKVDNLMQFDLKDTFGLRRTQIHSRKKPGCSDIHLVRMEPRRDIVNSYPSESLHEYKYFVKQLMTKPTRRILPTLDKWFRIGQNQNFDHKFHITNKTRAGDMDRHLYWKLFLFVKSLPIYKDSVFLQAYQSDELRFSKEHVY